MAYNIAALGAVAQILMANYVSPAYSAPTTKEIEAAPCHARTPGTTGGSGCFVIGRQEIGTLTPSAPVFWHIDSFASVDDADRAKASHSVVVFSHGTAWLFTIAGAGWTAPGGRHVARIGPLPLVRADLFAVEYVEGDFPPGMVTRVHRHPGVEAFYTVTGETCLETPAGKMLQSPGGAAILVPGGTPMKLTAVGTRHRFGFAAVLQDASKPFSSAALDWKPRALCRP